MLQFGKQDLMVESAKQNGALGNTSSIEEAEYELIELETENDVSLFIS